jgi:hypothetical protein
MSRLTLLLATSVITAVSPGPGTWLGNQLDATLQTPAAVFVQVMIAAHEGEVEASDSRIKRRQEMHARRIEGKLSLDFIGTSRIK